MTQDSLFDPDEAKTQGERGMKRAIGAVRVTDWKTEATNWLSTVPRGELFTADDLIAHVGLPDEGVNRNNVVGAWFSAKSKKGQIEWCGTFTKSARVVRHGNTNRIWRRL